jgi:hypothetical protein
MKIISNLHTEFYLIRQRYFINIKAYIVLVALLLGLSTSSYSKNFYFSSSTGNDSYTATQAQNRNTPWKSIDQLNNSMNLFTAGDSILFKRGDIFTGQITLTRSGSSIAKISFNAYGIGNAPVIQGNVEIGSWTRFNSNIYVH